jgi:cadmium resistance transport/sequestration family protein
MNWFFTIIAAGITSFVATNLDDILILMFFFSQVNAQLRPRHIIIGQYLGFTVLIVASLPGLLGGFIIPKAWIGLLGLVPIFIGMKQWVERHNNEAEGIFMGTEFHHDKRAIFSWLTRFIGIQTYNVAIITIANGGDNIGIYVPLFANSNLIEFAIIVAIFYLLIGVWCWLAYQLTRHPVVAKLLTRYGHVVVPFVLISLGVFIVLESGSYKLLTDF